MKKRRIFTALLAAAICTSSISLHAAARSDFTIRGNAVIKKMIPQPTQAPSIYDYTYFGESLDEFCQWGERETDLVAVILENGKENFDPSAAVPGATLATNYAYTSGLGYGDDVVLGMFHQLSADNVHFKDIFLSDFDENNYAIVSGASEQAEKLYELDGVTDVYRMTALFILEPFRFEVVDKDNVSMTNEQYVDVMQQVREKVEANDAKTAEDLLPGAHVQEIAIVTPNNYALTRVYEPDATEITLGDVNFDGAVNLSDVILLRQAVSGSVTLFRTRTAGAVPDVSDIDRDGVTDSNDAVALLRFLLRMDESIG